MWDSRIRQRFEELRQPGRRRNAMEEAELAALIQALEIAEALYLKPATERLRLQNDLTEKQNRDLEKLVQRKQALVQRLQSLLAEAQAEERDIKTELASVIGGDPGASTDD